MALFSDGPISAIEDLTAQDSQLLEVAGTEGIDLGRKLALAQDELAVELAALLAGLAGAGIERVVVTPALKQWHAFRTLETIYRDACNSQLNDRYAKKQQGFRDMARWARGKLRETGIGMAADPLPQAQTPTVETAQGSLAPGTYFVTASWVNSAGEEGASASAAVVTIASGTLNVRTQDAPRNTTGWNVYVGTAPETMAQQNGTPIAAGQSWIQPGTLTLGRAPGAGQRPTYLQPVPRILQRG
jgi:hypothetical protein